MKHDFLRRLGALMLTLALVLSLAAPALAASSGGDGEDPPGTETEPAISLDKDSLNLTVGDAPSVLTVTITPEGTAAAVTWSSSDETVAAVNNGSVTPLKQGTAVITAEATVDGQTLKAECAVTVSWRKLNKIEVTGGRSVLNVSETTTYTASVDPSSADPSVVWSSSDTQVVTVDAVTGVVTGIGAGAAYVTATSRSDSSISGTREVQVTGVQLSAGIIPLTLGKSTPLSYQTFGAIIGQAGQASWHSSNPAVATLSGNRVTGRGVGTAIITLSYKVGSVTYRAVAEVRVTENTAAIATGEARPGVAFQLSTLSTRLDSICRDVTSTVDEKGNKIPGAGLYYITNLSVSPDQGVLYYHFVSSEDTGFGVAVGERYFLPGLNGRERSLADVVFLPNRNFSGVAQISYSGYNTGGEMYSGQIRLTVSGTGDVNYSIANDQVLTFFADDFNNVCLSQTGRTLSAVSFSLPTASQGKLYYSYSGPGVYGSEVSATSQYYRTRSPYLDQVTFVPAEKFTGTVTLLYRAVDTAGVTYQGTVTINVTQSPDLGLSAELSYSATPESRVSFISFDVNGVCQRTLGEDLYYVRFPSLPSSARGTLYFNYRADGTYDSKVTETTRYYRAGWPTFSNVSFVPTYGVSETITIPITCYTASARRLDVTLTIVYGERYGSTTIYYTANSGRPVLFEAADFNERSLGSTGSQLNYIRFTSLPSRSQGDLYYNYNTATRTGIPMTTSTMCYRSAYPILTQVAFVPKADFHGTVTLAYTGLDAAGLVFTGLVEITVQSSTVNVIRYDCGSSPITFSAADFRAASQSALGSTLSYVQFTSLDLGGGKLYYDYNNYSSSEVSLSGRYYYSSWPSLDRLTYVPGTDYIGTAVLSYNAVDTTGYSVAGVVRITVNNGPKSRFNDMTGYEWAIPAVEYLYNCGVVEGISKTKFGPGRSLKRCDYVLMLCRAFDIPERTTTKFSDVSAKSYYAGAVGGAAALNIARGDKGKFMPDGTLTRQDAIVMLKRAMDATGWRLPSGAGVDLSIYRDQKDISNYAKEAIGAMLRMGVLTGDEGTLRPKDAITRAEMADLLYRALAM